MKGYQNLQSLDSCHDLQMVDGYVSLNGEQLAEIEKALAEGQTEKALNKTNSDTVAEQLTEINELTQERDELKSQNEELTAKASQIEAKDQEIANLTTERDSLKEDNAKKDERIKELEDALGVDPDDEEAFAAMHNGNHAKEPPTKEPSDEEAMESARKAIHGEH